MWLLLLEVKEGKCSCWWPTKIKESKRFFLMRLIFDLILVYFSLQIHFRIEQIILGSLFSFPNHYIFDSFCFLTPSSLIDFFFFNFCHLLLVKRLRTFLRTSFRSFQLQLFKHQSGLKNQRLQFPWFFK